MKPALRDKFDRNLETVLAEIPERVRRLLAKVPLHVEDHPPEEVLRKVGVENREELCGLYTGIPLTQRSVEHSGTLPDVVTIYREGIISAARDARGHVSKAALRREIRTTVLHEIGHHHGLNEQELAELGYG